MGFALQVYFRFTFRYPHLAQKTVIFLKSPDAELWGMIGKIAKSSETMKESVSCVDQLESLRFSSLILYRFPVIEPQSVKLEPSSGSV